MQTFLRTKTDAFLYTRCVLTNTGNCRLNVGITNEHHRQSLRGLRRN